MLALVASVFALIELQAFNGSSSVRIQMTEFIQAEDSNIPLKGVRKMVERWIIVRNTAAKYRQAYRTLTGSNPDF